MEKMKQEILRAIAGSGGKGIGKVRAATRPPAPVFSMTPTGGSDMEEDIDVEAGEEAKRRQLRMSAASSQALDALARSSGQRSKAISSEGQLDDQAMQAAMQASLQDWQKSFWGHMRGDGSGAAASAAPAAASAAASAAAPSEPTPAEYTQGSDDAKF